MADRFVDIQLAKALTLRNEGRLDASVRLLSDLAVDHPDDPRIWQQWGMLSLERGETHEACRLFRELNRRAPDDPEGILLLGMTCAELGEHDEAIIHLRRVLDLFPGLPSVAYRIGLSLLALKRYDEALHAFHRILDSDPRHVGALNGIGLVLTETARIVEAREIFARALSIDPAAADVLNNMGRVHKCGEPEQSLFWFEKGLEADPTNPSLVSNYLYGLNYTPNIPREIIAARYRELAPRAYPPPEGRNAPKEASPSGCMPCRIGFVSADLYGHSVSFFLEPYMEHHDRSRFQLFCYSNGTREDETTVRLRSHADSWRSIVGMPDGAAARLIREDRIDILVDLSGHTAGNRLGIFALRPAPIQVSWLGHPNTTGLPQMDYYLTDSFCDPEGETDHLFTERLLRLPRTFCTYLPPERFPPVSPPPFLTNREITFGSFNNLAKVNQEIVGIWCRILHSLPGSRIMLKDPKFEDPGIRREIAGMFQHRGIPPDRTIFRGIVPTRYDHLSCYGDIDIALDTFPYHGTTTTCESLWMGVPVITLAGKTHVSRVGVSLLNSVGLSDLVAETPDEYVARAVRLARNSVRLGELRETLRLMMARSPLMDYARFARGLEKTFGELCACQGRGYLS